MPPLESPTDSGKEHVVKADRNGVITHWGTSFERTFGYSAEEALGQKVSLIIPPALEAHHWRGFNKAVAAGQLKREGKTLKVPAIHKNGTVLAVEGQLSLAANEVGTVESVVLRLLGEGPRWAPPVWRAVLAVLKAAQSSAGHIRRRRARRIGRFVSSD